jgi:hypothetical protein
MAPWQRWIGLSVAAVIVLALGGCSSEPEQVRSTTSSVQESAAVEATATIAVPLATNTPYHPRQRIRQ